MRKILSILILFLLVSTTVFATYRIENVVSGSTTGNVRSNSSYEYISRLVWDGGDKILDFQHEGGDLAPDPKGVIICREYSISGNSWGSEVRVYDPGVNESTFDHFPRIYNGTIQMYIDIYDVGDVFNGSSAKMVRIVSDSLSCNANWSAATTVFNGYAGHPAGWFQHPTDSNIQYMPVGGISGANRLSLLQTSDNGETFTQGPIAFGSATAFSEAGCVQKPSNLYKMLCVIRDNAGDYVYASSSSDGGQTWTAPYSTGMGSGSGATVTPKLILASGREDRVVLYFYDRGHARSVISGPTLFDNAMQNNWIPLYFLSSVANQGNGDIVEYNTGEYRYMITTADETGSDTDPTNTLWWLFKDIYMNTRF